MQTYHFHIRGRVQGVGFRPFICQLARQYNLTGTVANSTDGVHIHINTDEESANLFYQDILIHAPENSIITHHKKEIIDDKQFTGFRISESETVAKPDLLITPDIALCSDCRDEITSYNNRRNGYAFTTCLHCGPRYSIINTLPYDRQNTTMKTLNTCPTCNNEYKDINDRRHFSQTNSCPHCAINMHLYLSANENTLDDQLKIIPSLIQGLKDGKTAAVKGIGGYLLLCDATNKEAIQTLRIRKHRPYKPFAVLYPDIMMAMSDLYIDEKEAAALTGKISPIVLCSFREENILGVARELTAPRLDKQGVMLPYTSLLQLIASQFKKPMVATSANLSGSPIIYTDAQALDMVWDMADIVLTYDREIVTPQDDSIWQYTGTGQRIILRRSRGMAPDYYPHYLGDSIETIFATGADMKSTYAIQDNDKIYISQYLGDQADYLSQQSYKESKEHLLSLLNIHPAIILSDAHPNYHTNQEGKKMALESDLPHDTIQHHKAHFAAVLAENDLINPSSSVLGFIWDGTGYGDDGQIWGGEVFRYDQGEMDRILFLDYFPQLLGDKMSLEPRLSALSILRGHPSSASLLTRYFSTKEWDYYQKLLTKEDSLLTSSMGRLIDGIAALMGVCPINSYEGQTAIEFEALARSCRVKINGYYPLPIRYNRIDWRIMLEEMISELASKEDKAYMAKKFYLSLVHLVEQVSDIFDINELAFSGGVFQNALLNELIASHFKENKKTYFHKRLSPNDECISFGQLAMYKINHYPYLQEANNQYQSVSITS